MKRVAGNSPRHRSRFALFALLALVAVSGTGALRYYLRTDDATESARIMRLAETVGPHRVAQARLTGGFAYVKLQTD